ncbi:hypothetical protein [Paraburkholderia unamae]|uniref:Uncharacterized protein n=1 Tax=Paraburkholderia unamae TaxID=219649 RepID=A0ABX5KUG9_9BURK|nr:hypothetical protein [Paraburkholderia unamae]PVX86696.1 hypothetical protein C7402_102533 [Paraburkholderia unamae]CAG9274219.1 conserved hypothetical protein [Paraburkholderia unamae]
MSVFFLRRAPGVRWTPRLPEHRGEHDGGEMPRTSKTSPCDLVLPESFALRLAVHHPVTPRSPVRCPLDETALRQWCVRLQNDDCPNKASHEAPMFLKRSR